MDNEEEKINEGQGQDSINLQSTTKNYSIANVKIIKEKPMFILTFINYEQEYRTNIYASDLEHLKIGDYIGDLNSDKQSERLTKIAELPQGDLYLFERKIEIEIDQYELQRDLIIFKLH